MMIYGEPGVAAAVIFWDRACTASGCVIYDAVFLTMRPHVQ